MLCNLLDHGHAGPIKLNLEPRPNVESVIPKSGMRRLVAVTLLFVGLGEAAYGTVIVSIAQFGTVGRFAAALAWITLTYSALALWVSTQSRVPNRVLSPIYGLIQKSSHPHRASLYLHSIYNWSGPFNATALIFAAIFGARNWDPLWGFFAGTAAVGVIFYNRSVLGILGQRYVNNRGVSFVVAANLARLANKMFSGKNINGFGPLYLTFGMLNVLFYKTRYRPVDFHKVWATIRGLEDLAHPPYEDLAALSESISSLPVRDALPTQFSKFLTTMKWPSGFELVRPKRGATLSEVLTIVVTAVIAVGAVLVILPRAWQDALVLSLAGFFGQQVWNILAAIFLIAGIVYPYQTILYSLEFWMIRTYMVD